MFKQSHSVLKPHWSSNLIQFFQQNITKQAGAIILLFPFRGGGGGWFNAYYNSQD